MYLKSEFLDLAKNRSVRVFWVANQEFGGDFYE